MKLLDHKGLSIIIEKSKYMMHNCNVKWILIVNIIEK